MSIVIFEAMVTLPPPPTSYYPLKQAVLFWQDTLGHLAGSQTKSIRAWHVELDKLPVLRTPPPVPETLHCIVLFRILYPVFVPRDACCNAGALNVSLVIQSGLKNLHQHSPNLAHRVTSSYVHISKRPVYKKLTTRPEYG